MGVFAEQRLQWTLCGTRPHSRLMSKAGGPVLILLWLKQPPQQEIHLTAPGFCPLSQQVLGSSLPPLTSASHYRPAYTSTPPSLQPLEKEIA